jgi:hypothetical protein
MTLTTFKVLAICLVIPTSAFVYMALHPAAVSAQCSQHINVQVEIVTQSCQYSKWNIFYKVGTNTSTQLNGPWEADGVCDEDYVDCDGYDASTGEEIPQLPTTNVEYISASNAEITISFYGYTANYTTCGCSQPDPTGSSEVNQAVPYTYYDDVNDCLS